MADDTTGRSAWIAAARPYLDRATASLSTGYAPELVAFTATTFLSATLLFSVQPMFAKMVLPVLGGSPSVWAVALCFFQGALLAGYLYAHLLISRLTLAQTGMVHLAVCVLAFVALPIGLPSGWSDPPAGEPYLWQLGLFAVAIGLPFMAVSANAPLLQAWFAATPHPNARDPYFMYAASNLGSLISLLAYPLVLEPAFGLAALSRLWTVGFVALAAALALCFWLMWRTQGDGGDRRASAGPSVGRGGSALEASTPAAGEAGPGWLDRLGWVGLALVPSALLTAFTTHVTTDVASAPLLWVIPLALYLLTFVLVFRGAPIVFLPALALVAPAAWLLARWVLGTDGDGWLVIGAAVALTWTFMYAYVRLEQVPSRSWLLGLHLAAVIFALLQLAQTKHDTWFVSSAAGVAVFFTSAMVAHRTLYEARPAARHLTEFYLWMSLGGGLGGIFAALIAPRLFSEVFEYPLLLALSMACRPGALRLGTKPKDELAWLWLILAAGFLAVVWLPSLATRFEWTFADWGSTAAVAALGALTILIMQGRPPRQLAAALVMFMAVALMPSGVRKGDAVRSYFGVYRVLPADGGDYRILMHGTTLHGAQRVRDDDGKPVENHTPATYYHPKSPMAKAVGAVRQRLAAAGRADGTYGVVGLGTGSLACLSQPGETWRFFEIDPAIVRIASDPANFTFLAHCQPKLDIVIGDARLTIAKQKPGTFDLIIVDAFSSDAVPVHLMTAEAIALFLDKLSPDGVVVLHISNRYLDLDAVLGATAPYVGAAKGLIVSDDTSDGSYASTTSTIGVFAKSDAALDAFRAMEGAADLDGGDLRPWTDDYSDILGPFMSKVRRRSAGN